MVVHTIIDHALTCALPTFRHLFGRPNLYTTTTQRGWCIKAFVSMIVLSQSQKTLPGGGVWNLSSHATITSTITIAITTATATATTTATTTNTTTTTNSKHTHNDNANDDDNNIREDSTVTERADNKFRSFAPGAWELIRSYDVYEY